MSDAEQSELDELHAKVCKRNAVGQYYHWTRVERDRVRSLMRRQSPWLKFAPSTEEMARRFGHLSQRP